MAVLDGLSVSSSVEMPDFVHGEELAFRVDGTGHERADVCAPPRVDLHRLEPRQRGLDRGLTLGVGDHLGAAAKQRVVREPGIMQRHHELRQTSVWRRSYSASIPIARSNV